MLLFPFIIGIVSGIIAKLVDVTYITSRLPVFDDIMGRFAIWIWAAALISIRSKTALLASARSFLFFAGMLSAYYSYTVIFLHFSPKSQILLWGSISMIAPLCGFLIWQVHREGYYTNFISSLPFILLLYGMVFHRLRRLELEYQRQTVVGCLYMFFPLTAGSDSNS